MTDDTPDRPVVLFDGVCNLCVGSLPWLLRMDRQDRLRFGTLQSEAASELLRQSGLSGDYDESMVVIEGDRAYTESDAVVRIAWLLGFPWALGSVASIVPKTIRDRAYRFLANNRYDWFGKRGQCLVPDEKLRARFID
ncbi:thiol-disulfide oxidoreductase DCC family protein [Natronomonas sp. F2-12]|jgi:predicted DCC family thiol-disulfide oxidoreductase YuxK|uniref:Thiol-disulfide oxidoreductase DCC family protein n=1 Tax=Natronomonas aquatica TaxID=2841590 RepID=A0A9R1CTA5_9EURY|nr:thiol-disulfide oxidoreductase DCC family protein [Natronomonas aquatica]MCQ4333294.1 thiol-disulfide oxidoreductase DCC family protein [Natronomonas aquatica]